MPTMSILNFCFALALLYIAWSTLRQLHVRNKFRQALDRLELRENCLLTRHPLVLLCEPPSLWRIFDRSEISVRFLREHGYDVKLLYVSRGSHVASLQLKSNAHVIVDSRQSGWLQQLASELANAKLVPMESLNLIASPGGILSTHASFRPSAIAINVLEEGPKGAVDFTFESRLLDFVISLAERDALTN